MTASSPSPVVEEVLRFEDLPVGSLASRRAIVRWSDGAQGEGLRWYGDEVRVCEGDLIGKTPRATSVPALPQGPRVAAVVAGRDSPAGRPDGLAVRSATDNGGDAVPPDRMAAPALLDALRVVVP